MATFLNLTLTAGASKTPTGTSWGGGQESEGALLEDVRMRECESAGDAKTKIIANSWLR
jgi:hypothetical protein